MQSNISLLIDATRSASRFLTRDYAELEVLQASSKDTSDFVAKAKIRVSEGLHKSLSKYYKNIVFDAKELDNIDFTNGPVILAHPLGGSSNFARAIPFFAVIVVLLARKNDQIFADKIVVNFPALGEIYYAEKGKGAWVEKNSSNSAGGAFRLRTSGNSKIVEALVACNYSEFQLAEKISSNIRNFGSCSYQLTLLASGKVDCILLKNKPIIETGFDLLIREAGGVSYVNNGIFVGCNFQLQEKVKQLI